MNKDSKISMFLLPNIKVMIKLLPIWTMLLMFAVIFQQPATFFIKQGMTMKRNIGANFKIPLATLQSAITLSITLLMPLYDRNFILFAQLITRQKKGINVMQRLGIGMVLSIIAMVIAVLVEMKRLATGRQMRNEGLRSEIVSISIFWLLPQYIHLGISDIFEVVGMQKFFYGEVPKNIRTMGIALYTSVSGAGSFATVSALMITLVEVYTSSKGTSSWFSGDLVEARLDNYYRLLACCCIHYCVNITIVRVITIGF
jgi:peptide/histidine transporter 3/4